VREHGGRLDVLHVAPVLVGVPRAQHALHARVAEEALRVLVVRGHQPVALDGAEPHRGAVVPHQHQHRDALVRLPDEQLAEVLGRRRRRLPRVAHQHDVRVHGPPGDVHHPPGPVDGVEHVHPAPARLVEAAVREPDARREVAGDVGVLVQPNPAAAALLEEGVGNAAVRAAADAGAPPGGRVGGDVGELELDAYLVTAFQRLPLLVADGEPQVHLLAGDDALRGKVGAADERGADGVVGLDGEDDVAGVVRAVDVEGLVPLGGVHGGHHARPPHARLVDVHRRVQLAVRAQADGILQLLLRPKRIARGGSCTVPWQGWQV